LRQFDIDILAFDRQTPGAMDNPGNLLTNPYFIAISSPVAVLLLGTMGKAIIKGGWNRQNVYLGFDASLTALYAAIVYLFDVARDPQLITPNRLKLTGAFLIVTFILFFFIVICHQIWEKEEKKAQPVTQFLVLGVFANSVGFGLLVAFVLLLKGV
jgi:hypothetical protein